MEIRNRKGLYKNIPKCVCYIFFIFLWMCLLPDISFPQQRLDIPTADLGTNNPVPFHLVEKIALVKSEETWGNGSLGKPIPLSDMDGNIIAYMFPYYIGGERFPSYDEILQQIKKGRELREHIIGSRIENARGMYYVLKEEQAFRKRGIKSKNNIIAPQTGLQPEQIEPVRPDSSISRRIEVGEIKEMEKFAAKTAIGADDFGTIVVSATYDMFPVPVYMHYLPPYYAYFDKAMEKAGRHIGNGAFLKRIYWLGLQGQYFEFVNNGNNALINAKTLEVLETNDIRDVPKIKNKGFTIPTEMTMLSTAEIQTAQTAIQNDISMAWEQIKSEVGAK